MKRLSHVLRCLLLLALVVNGMGLGRVTHMGAATSAGPHCHHAHALDSDKSTSPGQKHTQQQIGGGCFCGGACSCGCTLQAGAIVDATVVELPVVPSGVDTVPAGSLVAAVLHPLLRPPIA